MKNGVFGRVHVPQPKTGFGSKYRKKRGGRNAPFGFIMFIISKTL